MTICKVTASPGPRGAPLPHPCLWAQGLITVHYSPRPLQCLRHLIFWPQIFKNKTLGLNEAFEVFMKGFLALELNSMVSVYTSIGHSRHGVEPQRSDMETPGLPLKVEPLKSVAWGTLGWA